MLTPVGKGSSGDHLLTLSEVANGLLGDGWITRRQVEQLKRVVHEVSAAPKHPLVLLAEQAWMSATDPPFRLDLERLTRWLAERARLPYLRIDPLKIDVAAVTGVIKQSYAKRFEILPVAVRGQRVTIATAQPYAREWERELARSHNLEFELVVANPQTVARYRDEFYSLSKSLSGAIDERAGAPAPTHGNFEQFVELGSTTEPDSNDAHVVRIVDWMFQYAFEQRASDIHLEPRREESNVRFRIDGVLHLVNQLPTPILNAAISRLKALGRMDVIERRRPQDGRVKTKTPAGKEVELRLSTMPTTFGEKLVMRIFDPDVLLKNLAELGFDASDAAAWDAMVSQPHGLVIVSGPTGSGKTTTLYSALKQLARPDLNVCTIEDPIELVNPSLNQMNVQPALGLDFAAGVRTLLRQDPDIIMVGEIRDASTADAAVQAALTGHLVLTTLHTNDAPSAVTRLLDLGVAPYLIKAALLGVLAQRLVRTLCPHCKRPGPMRADEWTALTAPNQIGPPERSSVPVGCDECRHTGYLGRTGIYETLSVNDDFRRSVTADADSTLLRKVALENGLRSLRMSGALKVGAGLTTAAEVFGVTQASEDTSPTESG